MNLTTKNEAIAEIEVDGSDRLKGEAKQIDWEIDRLELNQLRPRNVLTRFDNV